MLLGATAGSAALIALLAIPVTLRFRIAWRRTLREDIRLHWAFGLVRARVRLTRPESRRRRRGQAGRAPDRPAASTRKRHGGNPLGALRERRFRRRILRFVSGLWRAVHKKDVELRVRVGLGDPADTGRLWALAGPAAGLLAGVRGASIRLEPDFLGTTFELDGRGTLRLIPLRVIGLVAGLLLSPAFWRGIRTLRRGSR